jgi:hypothetical protein
VKIFIFLFVLLVLINSILIPFLYTKLWFLFFTTLVLFLFAILRKFIKKENYNNSIFLVLLFIALSNLLIVMLGYTTNFVVANFNLKKESHKNVLYKQQDTIIKCKVFVLGLYKTPIVNAKISVYQNNNIIDTFCTNLNGEYEYIVPKEVDLNDYISLKIEHPDFEPYETKFILNNGSLRELEVYLVKKVSSRVIN